MLRLIRFWTVYQRYIQQEAQLVLTNPRDAFRGQSRSPNSSMLGIVSSCATVTLSLRRAVFTTVDFKKCHDLEIGVRGHSRSLKEVPFYTPGMVSYWCSIETLSLTCTVFEIFAFSNTVTLKSESKVTQGHHLIEHI